jgi:hypothetical protein
VDQIKQITSGLGNFQLNIPQVPEHNKVIGTCYSSFGEEKEGERERKPKRNTLLTSLSH